MQKQATPAVFVTRQFGGARAVARALSEIVGREIQASTVTRWARNPARADAEAGYIPPVWHRPLLKAAQQRGIDLRAEHLVVGGPIEEPEP